MGKHEEIGEISEATRAEVRDDWVVTRCVSRTAQKFGLANKAVKQIIYDAAVFASLPKTVKCDIDAEVRRLQMMMDRYWPDAMAGDKRAAGNARAAYEPPRHSGARGSADPESRLLTGGAPKVTVIARLDRAIQ